MPLRPNQTFNFIAASLALSLVAEGALLWKLSQSNGSVAPAIIANLAATPAPTSASFFVAPGVAPSSQASDSASHLIPPVFSAPNGKGKKNAAPAGSGQNALAKTYFEAATAALAKKDNRTALENFRRVAQIAPDNLPTRLNLALLYLGANQPAAAIPHLQKAAQLDRKSAAPRFQLAQAYLALKKPALAMAPLEEVVKLAPGERVARALLAQVYLSQKRPRDAYAQWGILAQSQPRDVEAHLQAATLAADELKRPREAEKWLRRAQNATPKDPRAALLLGRLFLGQNQPREAAQTLSLAAKNSPNVFDIYPALANARLAAGDLSGARGALQSALSRVPVAKNDAQKLQVAQIEGGLRLTLGRVWGQSKKPKAAKQEFERAAALLPRDAEPRSLLALAALQSGDKKTARNALQDALSLDPRRAADRLTLAQLFAQNQNWRAADEQYAAYAKLQPHDKLALTQWAQVAAHRNHREQSLQIWSQIAALDPKNPLPLLQSGVILRTLKRPAPALAAFERALQLRPNDASALFEVARLQSTLKKPGAALTWRELIAIQPDYLPAYAALLDASQRSGAEASTRLFLARQLSRGKENPRALSEILRFYQQQNRSAQAKALLADIVQRNPKAKTARAALDSFGASTSGVSTSPRNAPAPGGPTALPSGATKKAPLRLHPEHRLHLESTPQPSN
ncbi:Tfp pilus assembly protein PilF [Abditibacterium utsteinense]|uniref:Tfp pilus assembly protein PilF n=1 Tax=Abditibacterium utsteinense TaxID=1960156 RepID=A0A2S8SVS6_9BACT|nr:tetratricopeptide repeat protein [Abditibacterium utsteinense]PQV64894.1 Tfp pilus assembly protein PilF [Abditibacterium utsteinense]